MYSLSPIQDKILARDSRITDPQGEVDIKLMVDLLVSLYRLNPRHVTSYVFPLCMDASADMVLRTVLVTSLKTLALEGLSCFLATCLYVKPYLFRYVS